jgi:hypothetical protein
MRFLPLPHRLFPFPGSPEREKREAFMVPGVGPVPPQGRPPKPDELKAKAPEQQQKPETGGAQSEIENISAETANKGAEAVEEKLEGTVVAEKAKSVAAEAADLHETLMELDKSIIAAPMDDGEKKQHRQINMENMNFLRHELPSINKFRDYAAILGGWESGEVSPSALEDCIRNDMFEGIPHADIFDRLDAFKRLHPDAYARWHLLDPAQRKEYVRDLGIDTQGFLKIINDALKLWEKTIKEMGSYTAQFKSVSDAGEDEEKKGGHHIPIIDNIEFVSFHHIINSIKKVKESYSNAWKKWSLLKEANLSNRFGKLVSFLPFHREANMELDQAMEGENEKVMKEYMDHLEHQHASFEDIVDPTQGYLHLNRNDGNKFRGVLKYCASRGWLYQMNAGAHTIFGYELSSANRNVPPTWDWKKTHEFVQDLEREDGQGQKKSIDNGYSRVENLSDIPPMIDVLEQELRRHNYWAVWGIANRAIQKGKEGETSGWISTTIMRHIREDPIGHRFLPIGLMDKLGNIGIQSAAWLTTYWKLDRKNIQKFQRDQINFEDGGTLAKAIWTAEQDVLDAERTSLHPRALSKQDLDRLTAQVLTTRTVREPHWTRSISVFNSKYTFYRDKYKDTSIKAGETDDDFYNIDNGGSEPILLKNQGYSSVLAITSTGNFQHNAKAMYFLDQLIRRHDDLQQNLPGEEYQNFVREVQGKMEAVLTTIWSVANSSSLAPLRYGNSTVMYELVKRRLLPEEAVRKMAKDNKIAGLAQALVTQLDQKPLPPNAQAAPRTP